MSPICYYFVNNTRKEFCLFNNEISIFYSLSNAIENNAGWKNTDSIAIETEIAGETALMGYLINKKGFKDMDWAYQQSCV
jgi:hypothetical protein